MTAPDTFLGGINEPQTLTPSRVAGSIRRTMHTDMSPAVGGGKQLSGTCRDLVTAAGAEVVATDIASFDAHVDEARNLLTLAATPAPPEGLTGRSALGGFRAALDERMPSHDARATPLYALLDELPVAALISGYADMYTTPVRTSSRGMLQANICSGWRDDGMMMRSLRATGAMPIPLGPDAPALEATDDPVGWHPIGELGIGAMRRRRRLDVWHDGEKGSADVVIDAMFRDTHVEPSGRQIVLHEYRLEARLHATTRVFTHCVATPTVLPWDECPAAAASAGRVVGVPVGEVRLLVRKEFKGTSICTHLNDLVRSLAFVEPLLERLDATIAPA